LPSPTTDRLLVASAGVPPPNAKLGDASTMTTTKHGERSSPHLSCKEVWRAIGHSSFAVLSHVNDAGEPRSSGIVYAVVDRHLYVAVDPTGWKARQIADGATVSVTVPVRRGGILSLLFPIPPATVSFKPGRSSTRPGRPTAPCYRSSWRRWSRTTAGRRPVCWSWCPGAGS
jgi:hypothetical protein